MVNITPLTVWHEGSAETVTKLTVISEYDDLQSTATLGYRLVKVIEGIPSENGVIPVTHRIIISGSVIMSGQDYIDWDNSNEAAYQYVADKLNITIVTPAP